ncbi:MAG: ABC transporter permease subunit [Pirellulales bacterium]|nr:ABC transporter permease subunit [Pirellulales bacterium]
MGIIARHQLRQMIGQRRLWLLVTFLLLPVAIAALTRGDGAVGGYAIMLYMMYPQSVCVLLALLYGSAVLSSEMEMQTLTYLFVRPIPRWHVVIGKYIATTLVLLIATNISFVMSWVATGSDMGGAYFAALGLATSLSIVAYTAVFTLLGVISPHKAMIFGILAAVVEFVLSLVPAIINTLTITYYLRSLVYEEVVALVPSGDAAQITATMSRVIGEATAAQAVGALIFGTALCLALACRIVTKRVYIEQADV